MNKPNTVLLLVAILCGYHIATTPVTSTTKAAPAQLKGENTCTCGPECSCCSACCPVPAPPPLNVLDDALDTVESVTNPDPHDHDNAPEEPQEPASAPPEPTYTEPQEPEKASEQLTQPAEEAPKATVSYRWVQQRYGLFGRRSRWVRQRVVTQPTSAELNRAYINREPAVPCRRGVFGSS